MVDPDLVPGDEGAAHPAGHHEHAAPAASSSSAGEPGPVTVSRSASATAKATTVARLSSMCFVARFFAELCGGTDRR